MIPSACYPPRRWEPFFGPTRPTADYPTRANSAPAIFEGCASVFVICRPKHATVFAEGRDLPYGNRENVTLGGNFVGLGIEG
jgi:hypothetical protein